MRMLLSVALLERLLLRIINSYAYHNLPPAFIKYSLSASAVDIIFRIQFIYELDPFLNDELSNQKDSLNDKLSNNCHSNSSSNHFMRNIATYRYLCPSFSSNHRWSRESNVVKNQLHHIVNHKKWLIIRWRDPAPFDS